MVYVRKNIREKVAEKIKKRPGRQKVTKENCYPVSIVNPRGTVCYDDKGNKIYFPVKVTFYY